MQYDSICLEASCIKNKRQLFCSTNQDNQIHFVEHHPLQLMHHGTEFFRSFNRQPIKLRKDLGKVYAQLQQQYMKSVQQMTKIMKAKFQQCQTKIRSIYDLNHKVIGLDLFLPHIQRKTFRTELYLALINWKKDHPQEDIKIYVQSMPEACIKDYTTVTNRFAESLTQNVPKPSKNVGYKIHQFKIQESQRSLNQGPRLVQEISKQISNIYERGLQLKITQSLSKNQQQIELNEDKEGTLLQFAEVFCNSQSQLTYRDIEEPLLTKLPTRHKFKACVSTLMNRLCLYIEEQIIKQFDFRKTDRIDRLLILIDLKNFRSWMNIKEANVFIRFVRFYMNINRDIEIAKHEIYLLHVLIMTRLIQKKQKKGFKFTYNAHPLDLKKKIIYLYAHFDNFQKVINLLIRRYPSVDKLVEEKRRKCNFKEIIIDTYNLLRDRELFHNDQFLTMITKEDQFCGEEWGKVLRYYIKYQLQGELDNIEKLELDQTMKLIVSAPQEEQQRERLKFQEKEGRQIIEKSLNTLSLSSLSTDSEDTFNLRERSRSSKFSSTTQSEYIHDSGLKSGLHQESTSPLYV